MFSTPSRAGSRPTTTRSLWPLVEKALHDERVLLVVDGFDEWASPDLARTCVDRLEVFANTKSAQVLASSRPFSTAEVPIDATRWRIGGLAALNREQQLEFIGKWLKPLAGEDGAEAEAAAWAEEIDASSHLRELSDLPLFLLLLLRSREQQNEFPEDLHAVLNDVVTRLVGEHRRSKIDTSGTSDQFPSSTEIRKVAAATAEYMHLESLLALSDEDLRDVFRRTLTDWIGYPDDRAYSMATALLNSLSPGVGLMVRPAPNETRFFHRSILEFLAAERLVTRPVDEVVDCFREHLADRRWTQVLRFLIRGLIRPPEIAAVFEGLDAADANDVLLIEAVEVLAAHTAVGAGNTEGQTRHRLLERGVVAVATSERDSHRAELLDTLVTGFSRPEVAGRVRTQVSAWLRGLAPPIWPSVLDACASWEPDERLLEMVWQGLLDDDDEVQRTAANVIGTKFGGQADVAERIANLATRTRLFSRRAAAIEGLSLGWHDHPALETLIERGRSSPSFPVRRASIEADLRRGNTTDENRAAAVELLDHKPRISRWSNGLVEMLIEHFPDDEFIFQHYVGAADPDRNRLQSDHPPATYLVLSGYTARAEARSYLLRLLSSNRPEPFVQSPALLTPHIPWGAIGRVYGEDLEVVSAVEALIAEHLASSIGDPEVYYCTLVARTDWVRDRLIDRVRGRVDWGIGWPIRALLERWPGDPAAQEALADIIDPDIGPVPHAALREASEITGDADVTMDLLARLAPTEDNQGAVVAAVNQAICMGASRDDRRVRDIVDRALQHDMDSMWTSPESALYIGFPEDPRVRELALARIDERGASIAAMVSGFRGDAAMRDSIVQAFRPLSAPLRGRLVEALDRTPVNDLAATELLARYDAEPDPVVKILAATAYACRAIATNSVTEDMVEIFTEQARALGPDLDERRAAAFCALAELGRLDRVSDLHERFQPDQLAQIRSSALSDQTTFYRYICRHWGAVKMALGDDFQIRFGYRDSGDSEFWRDVLTVAHDYPLTRDDIAQKLEELPALVQTAAALGYLSRTEPRSDRLREATIHVLQGTTAGSYYDIQPSWTALQVLEQQFVDDGRVHEWLDSEIQRIHETRAVLGERTYLSLPPFGTIAAIRAQQAGSPSHWRTGLIYRTP